MTSNVNNRIDGLGTVTDETGSGEVAIAREPQIEERTDAQRNGQLVGRDSDLAPDISFVMPTLNEERGITECITRAREALDELGLVGEIIVSDSSTDRTPELAAGLGAIVVEPERPGYGNAYKYAFEHTRGEYVVIGDADTTYDFTELPKLFEVATRDDVDIVMGSRLAGEIKPGAMPRLHRYIGNPMLTAFLNTFYDAGVSDAHSGFRVLSREALEDLDLQTGGMEFASEMVMDAAAKGMTIEEVPITYHEREGEATLDSLRDGWRHVKFMLENAPGYLFSLPAAIVMVFGIALMGVSLVGMEIGSVTFGLQTMIGGSLCTIVGYQIGSLAVFSSIATNPIREPQDPLSSRVRGQFRLEHGASVGLILFVMGAIVLSYAVVAWTITGYAAVPSSEVNLLALTVTVIGAQTIFSSFFLSMICSPRTGS